MGNPGLDEPSSGLDPVVRRDILGAIIRIVADEGRTVLFSSHLLDEVERVADRVTMMYSGKIVMDTIKETHHRVVVRTENGCDLSATLPGVLHSEGSDKEWTLLCNAPLEEIKSAAAQSGGEVVEFATSTLEEIFVARVRKPLQKVEH